MNYPQFKDRLKQLEWKLGAIIECSFTNFRKERIELEHWEGNISRKLVNYGSKVSDLQNKLDQKALESVGIYHQTCIKKMQNGVLTINENKKRDYFKLAELYRSNQLDDSNFEDGDCKIRKQFSNFFNSPQSTGVFS